MDKPELKRLLGELGWNQAVLSRRLGLDVRTVSRWQVVPMYAVAYIKLVHAVHKVLGDLS